MKCSILEYEKIRCNMSKFNNSYERLYEYWSYGWAIDYNVEKQLEDWITISREYTKLSKAFDNACELLEEYSAYDDPTPKDEWKEWLLNHDE